MRRVAVDNFELERWRSLDSSSMLKLLCVHAKRDASFRAVSREGTTRWHCNVEGAEFELLCCGSKFFDTRAARGGGGGVDLVMHLMAVNFGEAVRMLRAINV